MNLSSRTSGCLALASMLCAFAGDLTVAQAPPGGVPAFEVDASWPRFEGNWIFGSIGGVFVDPANDHVWVLNRPRTVQPDENYAAQTPPLADCCVPPPYLMEFSEDGRFLKSWGGPGNGYEWPQNEHGLLVDPKGNFWIASNGKGDAQVLKFNRDGKFLLQIGRFGKSAGSNDESNFASSTKAFYKEAFVAREVRTPTGTVVTMAFSPDKAQQFLYVTSGDQKIRILDRQSLRVLGSIGRLGHYAGQFHHITDIAVDSKGNLYTGENAGRRVQKFVFKGMAPK